MRLADTDVLVDYLAGRQPAADHVEAGIAAGLIVTTVVSRFELFSGAKTAVQAARIRTLLEAVPSLPLTVEAADRAAEIRRSLEQQGRKIGSADCLIAGIALTNDLALLTRNRRHFERVVGLQLAGI